MSFPYLTFVLCIFIKKAWWYLLCALLLQVLAQDPYLHVENNTGLTVQQGGITAVTSANLSVLSNLDIRDEQEVTFEVFLPPRHGVLCFHDTEHETGSNATSTFTQKDLSEGRLLYRHDGSQQLYDEFNVTTTALEKKQTRSQMDRGRREVHLDIRVPIKVLLESHQRPPTVASNRPVEVEEGQNVSLSRYDLEVRIDFRR